MRHPKKTYRPTAPGRGRENVAMAITLTHTLMNTAEVSELRVSPHCHGVSSYDMLSKVNGGPVATRTPDLYRVKVAL